MASTHSTARLRLPPRPISDNHDHVSIVPIATQRPESDYGSDLEIDDLLDELDAVGVQSQIVPDDLEIDDGQILDSFDVATTVPLFSSQTSRRTDGSVYYSAAETLSGLDTLLQQQPDPSLYPEISAIVSAGEYTSGAAQIATTFDSMTEIYHSPSQKAERASSLPTRSPDIKTALEDPRPPLERFRSRRGLSVSDIVQPAWCELQFFFTMAIRGKRKDTPAMKQGREVHAQLEAEVHSFVPIAIKTKEERWGLRIWNTIQGLRTLRQTGTTRELDVFGILDGQLVLGVIDELSYTCPDPDLEEKLAQNKDKKPRGIHDVSPTQKTLNQFFRQETASNPSSWIGQLRDLNAQPKIYIADTKTTGRKTVPPESYSNAARMQLMLYRQLLIAIATNSVPADALFEQFGLDAQADFSSTFIDEIAALDAQFAPSSQFSEHEATFNTPEASASELHTYHNLNLIWSAMIQEFMITIPNAEETVGQVLNIEYRRSADGTRLGNRAFAYDAHEINKYVTDELDWWKGKRAVKGVEIEDAFKCHSCEFAEGCEWRIKKVDEAVKRARSRSKKKDIKIDSP